MSTNDSVTVMQGLISCVRCGHAPLEMFMKRTTGQHYCKSCLNEEYKKTPKVKLVGVKDVRDDRDH